MNTLRSQVCAIAIMAKAPRIGEAKTRLAGALSAEAAAGLSASFIRDTAENIATAARGAAIAGYIAFSPPDAAAEFATLLPDGTHLLPSLRLGLGASLYDAAVDLLAAGYGSACMVNSDSPTLPTSLLGDAARALATPGDRIVLGPAEDGGYYLIGLKRAHARLFDDIPWSTPRVFEETVERAHEIGLDPIVLPEWYDVDDVASLDRLITELRGVDRGGAGTVPYRASHTAAFLENLLSKGGALAGGLSGHVAGSSTR